MPIESHYPPTHKGFKITGEIVAAVMLIGVVVVGGWWFLTNSTPPAHTGPVPIPTVDTTGWKTHRNGMYNFEFNYPQDIRLIEPLNENVLTLESEGVHVNIFFEPLTKVARGSAVERCVASSNVQFFGTNAFLY